MSQENVEIVRRGVEAYNRRDLDGILENWAPDGVVDWSALAASMQASFGGTTKSGRTGSACSTHSTKFGSSSLIQWRSRRDLVVVENVAVPARTGRNRS